MNSKYKIILPILLLIGVFAILLWYIAHVDPAVLHPQGPIGKKEAHLIYVTLGLSATVVIPVFVLLFVFILKYRDDNPATHHTYQPEWKHGRTAEIIWWIIPTIIITILAVIAWQSSHELDPYRPLDSNKPPLTIQVVSLDWKWLFIYPNEHVASVNLLEIPENTPIHFYLTSDAPMNSFWIPRLGGQIMTMPGMTTQLYLLASSTGAFNGYSANISGDGFAGMAFTVRSVSAKAFESWVETVKETGTPLDRTVYNELKQPSKYDPVAFYSPIADGLYQWIVTKYMTPTESDIKKNTFTQ
jgi:cytochrome o ubiquinol oxidase subunit 2